MNQLCVIHIAGPAQSGFQQCARCEYVFHDYRDGNVATLADDPLDPLDSHWPEGEEVLVLGGPYGGRYTALVSGLKPDRDTSDEVSCGR